MKATILLIEDNLQNRYLVQFLLEKRGHQVYQAETGPVGLELAAKVRPDLILLDVQLPGMDGHAVARALKSDPKLKSTPIVAVTSHAMAGDREKFLAAGRKDISRSPSTRNRSCMRSKDSSARCQGVPVHEASPDRRRQ
jgi:two-component system, cell cycle response regulator DivK